VMVLALVASTLAPFVRRRQAHAEERQQLKWLAFAAAGSSVTGAAGVLLAWNAAIAGSWRSTVQAVAVALLIVAFLGVVVGIPVTVGLAISKYRLYDIDRIINRVLVYGLLTAVLGLCYAAWIIDVRAGGRCRLERAELAGRWRHAGRSRDLPSGPATYPGGSGSALQPAPLRRGEDRRGLQRSATRRD